MTSSDSIRRPHILHRNGHKQGRPGLKKLAASWSIAHDEEAYYHQMVEMLARMSPSGRALLLAMAEEMAKANKKLPN